SVVAKLHQKLIFSRGPMPDRRTLGHNMGVFGSSITATPSGESYGRKQRGDSKRSHDRGGPSHEDGYECADALLHLIGLAPSRRSHGPHSHSQDEPEEHGSLAKLPGWRSKPVSRQRYTRTQRAHQKRPPKTRLHTHNFANTAPPKRGQHTYH